MESYWELLHEASHIFTNEKDEIIILRTVCDLLASRPDLTTAWIGLVDAGSHVVRPVAVAGLGEKILQRLDVTWDDSVTGAGPTGTVIRSKQAVVINQITEEPALKYWLSQIDTQFAHALCTLPLLNNGRVLGALSAYSREADYFTDEHVQVLQSLANLTAMALSSARTNQLQQTGMTHCKALQKATEALLKTLGLEEVLTIILSELQQVVPFSAATIMQTKGDLAEIVSSRGFSNPDKVKGITFDLVSGDNPNREIARSRKPLIVKDPVKVYEDFVINPYTATIRSWLGVPLLFGDHLIGMLSLDSHEPYFYTEEHARLAMDFAARAAIAIENARLYDRLRAYAAELEERVAIRTQELKEANEQLKELDRLKSKFVSDVSHELRTPITNLIMYIDLLERGNPEKIAKYIDILKDQAIRLAQLIESILDLSRLEVSRDDANGHKPVDLSSLVEQIVQTHIPRAEILGLQLVYRMARELPLVWGVQSHLAQVVTNLLANALNYTKAGYIHISTYLDSNTDEVCVEVRDSGIGIPSKDIEHIFSRFYRGANVSQTNFPGSGLGLAIVQEIIEQHKGRIEVKSTVGVGSIFQVYLSAKSK